MFVFFLFFPLKSSRSLTLDSNVLEGWSVQLLVAIFVTKRMCTNNITVNVFETSLFPTLWLLNSWHVLFFIFTSFFSRHMSYFGTLKKKRSETHLASFQITLLLFLAERRNIWWDFNWIWKQ